MNHLTDDAVARLPLSRARAELLEEIMSTPVAETGPDTDPTTDPTSADTEATRRPRRSRWAVPVAAAAAVAALVGVPTWLLAGPGDPRETPGQPAGPGASATSAAPAAEGELAVLDAPGWRVDHLDTSDTEGEIHYVDGGRGLSVHWRAAEAYDDYVADRADIGPVSDIELLGDPAQLWSYATDDHTSIGPVHGRHFLEVRGSGMPREEYLGLLKQLRRVDQAGLESTLRGTGMVTEENRQEVVHGMLSDVTVPSTFDRFSLSLEVPADRYQVGVEVTRSAACAWVAVYAAGQAAGDPGALDAARDAMHESRDWDILTEMARTGDWPAVVWDVGPAMAAGTPADRVANLVDCDGDGVSGSNP